MRRAAVEEPQVRRYQGGGVQQHLDQVVPQRLRMRRVRGQPASPPLAASSCRTSSTTWWTLLRRPAVLARDRVQDLAGVLADSGCAGRPAGGTPGTSPPAPAAAGRSAASRGPGVARWAVATVDSRRPALTSTSTTCSRSPWMNSGVYPGCSTTSCSCSSNGEDGIRIGRRPTLRSVHVSPGPERHALHDGLLPADVPVAGPDDRRARPCCCAQHEPVVGPRRRRVPAVLPQHEQRARRRRASRRAAAPGAAGSGRAFQRVHPQRRFMFSLFLRGFGSSQANPEGSGPLPKSRLCREGAPAT